MSFDLWGYDNKNKTIKRTYPDGDQYKEAVFKFYRVLDTITHKFQFKIEFNVTVKDGTVIKDEVICSPNNFKKCLNNLFEYGIYLNPADIMDIAENVQRNIMNFDTCEDKEKDTFEDLMILLSENYFSDNGTAKTFELTATQIKTLAKDNDVNGKRFIEWIIASELVTLQNPHKTTPSSRYTVVKNIEGKSMRYYVFDGGKVKQLKSKMNKQGN